MPNFTSSKTDRAYESFMKQVPGFQRNPPEAKVIQRDLDKDKRKGAQNERMMWYKKIDTLSARGQKKGEKYDRLDTEQLAVEELRALIWRYFMNCWSNRCICSTNGGLPPAVRRARFCLSLTAAAA